MKTINTIENAYNKWPEEEERVGAFLIRFLIPVVLAVYIVLSAVDIRSWSYAKGIEYWDKVYPCEDLQSGYRVRSQSGNYSIAIGYEATASSDSIAIGCNTVTFTIGTNAFSFPE